MKIEKGTGEYPMMSKGVHTLKFEGIESKRVKSNFPDGKADDGKAEVYLWKFTSVDSVDDHGVAEQIEEMTDIILTPNNNTAKFVRLINPKFDQKTDDFDPDDYQGKLFTAFIAHQVTPGGKTRAKIVSLDLIAAPTPPAPPAAKEDVDPFAD